MTHVVHSNVWAARFRLQRPCWLVLSRRRAGQACTALLAKGSITATTGNTLRSRFCFATAQGGTWPRHKTIATSLSPLTAMIIANMPHNWWAFGTHLSNSKRIRRVCGQLNDCMICGWLPAFCWLLFAWRLHSSACCLLVVCSLSLGF